MGRSLGTEHNAASLPEHMGHRRAVDPSSCPGEDVLRLRPIRKEKKNPVASEANANHVSHSIMDSSSPYNKTIDTKEEKWKLLLGEACHDMLAGSVLGLNPAAAGLGLSTQGSPQERQGWLPPFRAACSSVCLPPHFISSSPCSTQSMHSIYAAHSHQGGRDENR